MAMTSKGKTLLPRANSVLAGMCLTIIVGAICLYGLNLAGFITFSANQANPLIGILGWIQQNLGWSVAPFGFVLVWFVYLINNAIGLFRSENVDEIALRICEGRINLMISLFFGIGVIWTAIGMKDALLYALGDLDPESAASLGAWFVLERLVRGGILVALSTTIVGGVGGYLMSICRDVFLAPHFHRYEYKCEENYDNKLNEKLEQMTTSLASIDHKLK